MLGSAARDVGFAGAELVGRPTSNVQIIERQVKSDAELARERYTSRRAEFSIGSARANSVARGLEKADAGHHPEPYVTKAGTPESLRRRECAEFKMRMSCLIPPGVNP